MDTIPSGVKRIIWIATNKRHQIVGVWWMGCVQKKSDWWIACKNLNAKYLNKVEFGV